MNLLLDTHILLWSLSEPERLLPSHRSAIESPQNQIWVSSICLWEAVIKSQVGKLTLPSDFFPSVVAQGFGVLPFEADHAMDVLSLPLHHRDPFDRGLIAQARTDRLTFVSVDQAVWLYRDLVDLFPM